MSAKSEQLCRFYSRGKKCRFGDTCRYQHILAELPGDTTFTDQKSDIPVSERNPKFDSHSRAAISTGINKPSNHEGLSQTEFSENLAPKSSSISVQSAQRKICSYFSKHKQCAFGRNCRFLHERSGNEDAVKPKSAADEDSVNPIFLTVNDQHDSQVVEEDNQVHSRSAPIGAQDDKQNGRKICNYFARSGHCPYKRRCRFEHVKGSSGHAEPPHKETRERTNFETEEEGGEVASQNFQTDRTKETKQKVRRRLCRFFQRGHCKSGNQCRFWHPLDVMEDLTDDFESAVIGKKSDVSEDISTEIQSPSKVNEHPQKRPYQNRGPFRPANQKISIQRETATQDEIEKIRKTEVNQLQKRFPRDRYSVVRDESDVFECRIKFSPSDPDWPFDVRKFELLFTIPSAYPQEMLTISLPADQDLPETVRRYIELCVADWVTEKGEQLEEAGVYEIVFRPFLRWFDKTLQTNVTEALKQLKREMVAKAAGFEFINAAELQSKYKASEEKPTSDEETSEGMEESEESEDYSDDDDDDDDDDDGDDDSASNRQIKHGSCDMEAEKKGTEVSLKYLQLREGAATLLFEKIRIIIQCGRCKTHSDFSTPPGRVNSVSCSKCNNSQMLTFRPVLVHQFSSIIGYLDLDGCNAFDLVLQESVAVVGCMNCSRESKIDGIVPGQPLNTWCRHCHQKMLIAVESVRFAQLQPSSIETNPEKVHKIAAKKRVQKDPAIQEGKPLPQYGACKHYKKSYRWFRFPCCGMVYPCDVCHEEKSDGHEMIFANRVVCGFCCKEQPYSPDKPCTMCQQMLTRSKSSHWEGGLGCRSKIKMSKNDSQKYSNMSKTVSKHAQKLKETNSKKRTKLRHA